MRLRLVGHAVLFAGGASYGPISLYRPPGKCMVLLMNNSWSVRKSSIVISL